MADSTIILPVTVAGKTRDVTFRLYQQSASSNEAQRWVGYSDPVFTGRIGRGAKTHNCAATVWQFQSRENGEKKGYHATGRQVTLVEAEGSWWGIQLMDTVLNRHCFITGWREDKAGTSAHIMERY